MQSAKKRLLLIINPISGTLHKEGLADRVKEKLEPCGFEIESRETTHAGHARELARQAVSEGYYGVIVAGGDGTVNEVGSVVAHTPTAMGILPYGSGNGLARHLLTSIDIDHAIDVIARNQVTDCDYGTVNGRPFFCTFGLGFDAKVSHKFASMSHRGLISYIKSAIQQWFRYSPEEYQLTVTAGEKTHTFSVKAFIIAVCNASQYGNNAFIAPHASLRDGKLDLVVIHSGNRLTRAFAGAQLFSGSIDKNLLIDTFRVEKLSINRFPGAAHVDGEPLTMPQTLEVECHKGRIKLFTNPDKTNFKPFLTPLESMRDDSAYMMRENTRLFLKKIKNIFNPSSK